MNLWFRMYADVINDPKVMRLANDALRWQWNEVLCCTCKNGGKVPSTADLAFMTRRREREVALILTQLHVAGLLDKLPGGSFAVHNWDGRQYKSDTSKERTRAWRERNKSRDVASDASGDVTVTAPVTAPEQRQSRTEQKVAVADDDEPPFKVPARSLISPDAHALADKLLVIAGHDREFVPPGWCGAPLRVQTWLSQGWAPEVITAAVEGAAKRKSGAPAASVQFFERAIAEEVARQAQPVPTVNIKEGENINGERNPQSSDVRSAGTLIAAAARNAAGGIAFGPKPTGLAQPRSEASEFESSPPVRLLSAG